MVTDGPTDVILYGVFINTLYPLEQRLMIEI